MCRKCGKFFCCCCNNESEEISDESFEDTVNRLQDTFETISQDLFSYENMTQQLGLTNNYQDEIYINRGFNPGFIYIYPVNSPQIIQEGQKRTLQKVPPPTGWKLHISVKRTPDNLETAWKIMQLICINYKLSFLKTPEPLRLEELENGKEFCLYIFKNTHIEDWSIILNEMESLLKSNKIQPGEVPSAADKKIAGSDYFYYRNDTHPVNKEYIKADIALQHAKDTGKPAYNLCEADDPLDKIVIGTLKIHNDSAIFNNEI